MFCGTLHPYQEDGVNRAVARGCILLAYGMGTGKTVIALAALEELMGRGEVRQALIVVPASLRWQWAARIAQFADVGQRTVKLKGVELTVPAQEHCVVVDGTPAKREEQWLKIAMYRPDYVIVSYETVTSDWKTIRRIAPDAIILDEAQAIKNAGAARTKKIKHLHALYRFALTGTPMDNGRPEEIFSIMQWVDAEVFGRADLFDRAYVIRNKYKRAVGYTRLDVLYRTLSTAMVRKTAHDPEVALYMPQVRRAQIDVCLEDDTRVLYRRVEDDLQRALEEARDAAGTGVDVEAIYTGAAQQGNAALGRVSSRMLAARLLLCHPELVRISAAKYRAARARTDPGSAYAAELVAAGRLDGLEATPKLDALDAYVTAALADPAAKIIVFTAFREMLFLLAARLFRYEKVLYHGELGSGARAAAIARFSLDPDCRLFISTDAGGSGLDLPAASHVVNYDPPAGVGPWEQRNTRHTRANSAHRVVHVVDVVVQDTVEEHTYTRLRNAHAVAQAGVDNTTHKGVHKRASLSAHLEHTRTAP